MPLHWRTKLLTIFIAFVYSAAFAQEQASYFLSVKENLVSDSTIGVIWNKCDVLIVLSKDQCSNCSKNMTDLVTSLVEMGYRVIFARVIDATMMECKVEENYVNKQYDPASFYYLTEKTIRLECQSAEPDYLKFDFSTTPVLLVFQDDKFTLIPSEVVVDDYGRPLLNNLKFEVCKDEQ